MMLLMQNLNRVIKNSSLHFGDCGIIVLIFLNFYLPAYSQNQLSLPQEFQNLSINSRALETNFDFTHDKNSSTTPQNFNLDSTGIILHIKPSPKIKDDNIKIKIFSDENKEIKVFKFIDNTLFALIDPQKSYRIIQEIKPDCSILVDTFSLFKETTICPDSYEFKLKDNLSLQADSSLKLRLKKPSEFYKLNLLLNGSTEFFSKENFKFIEIGTSETREEEIANDSINIGNLLNAGKLCIVSSSNKTKNKEQIQNCTFNKNTDSILTFESNLKDKLSSPKVLTFVFPFLGGNFNNLTHEFIFEFDEIQKSIKDPEEINKKSEQKLILENTTINLSSRMGKINPLKTRIKKDVFSLNNELEINKELKIQTIKLPINQLEGIINLPNNEQIEAILTNLNLIATENNFDYILNILISNNIILKNLLDPEDEIENKTKPRLQQNTTNPELQIKTYFPESKFNIEVNKNYSFIEQTTAPSGNEAGKPVEIVNNKSKLDLTFSKTFQELNFTNIGNQLSLSTEISSKLLENKAFNNPLSLSGFLLPPDKRPVLEDNYRAIIEFSMTIKFKDNEFVTIKYSDLETKDETPLVNFFQFSFLPQGLYQTKIRFDGNREKLFESAGILNLETDKN